VSGRFGFLRIAEGGLVLGWGMSGGLWVEVV